jgi:hypothetical protein
LKEKQDLGFGYDQKSLAPVYFFKFFTMLFGSYAFVSIGILGVVFMLMVDYQ